MGGDSPCIWVWTVKNFTINLFLAAGSLLVARAGEPRAVPHQAAHTQESLTQHSDGGVAFLGGISVELAKVSSFVRDGDICQRHFEFTARKIQQLKPAVLQSCEPKHRGSAGERCATPPRQAPSLSLEEWLGWSTKVAAKQKQDSKSFCPCWVLHSIFWAIRLNSGNSG